MVTVKLLNKFMFSVGQEIRSLGTCWFDGGGCCPSSGVMTVVDVIDISDDENGRSRIIVEYDGQEHRVEYGNGFLVPYDKDFDAFEEDGELDWTF